MKNDNYNNIFENMSRAVLKVSESMAKIVEEINVAASSQIFGGSVNKFVFL